MSGKTWLVDEIGQFTAIPNDFIKASANMSDNARWLFVLFRFYTNGKTGEAFPSYDELQEKTGWRRPEVSAAIKELLKSGWLVRQKRFGSSPIYRIVDPNSSPARTNDSSSPDGTTDETQKFTRPNCISSPVRTALVHTGGTLTRLNNQTDSNQTDIAASPPPAHVGDETVDATPSRPEVPANETLRQPEVESIPPAAAPPATWDDLERAVDAMPPRTEPVFPNDHFGWYEALIYITTGWTRYRFEQEKSETVQKAYHAHAKKHHKLGRHVKDLLANFGPGGWRWQTQSWKTDKPGLKEIDASWGDWKQEPTIPAEEVPPPLKLYTPPPVPERTVRHLTPDERRALKRLALMPQEPSYAAG